MTRPWGDGTSRVHGRDRVGRQQALTPPFFGGAVTPLRNDVPTLWEGLLAGRRGAGPIALFDPSDLEVRMAAEVKDFDPVALLGRHAILAL